MGRSLNPIVGLGCGITRRVTNSKYLRSGWSKGTGTGRMGKLTKNYKFVVEPWRVREWKIPDVSDCQLTPYMDPELPKSYKPERDEITKATHSQIFSFKEYFKPENLPQNFSEARKQRWLEAAEEFEEEELRRKTEEEAERKRKVKEFYQKIRKRSMRSF